jgi:hypothetical protein
MTQALATNGRAHTVAKSQTLRSRGIRDRQARATTADHVIYRYDPRRTPCLTYHSISGGLTGGADTLAEARESYRQLARIQRQGVPPAVVVVEPDETVSAVLDQTRTDDTLFVVHSDAETTLRWIAINGPDEAGSRRAPLLMDRDHLRAMPIKDLTQAYSVGPKSFGSSRVSSVTYRDSWSD